MLEKFKARHPFMWIGASGVLLLIDNVGRVQTVKDAYAQLKQSASLAWPSHLLTWIGLACLLIGILSMRKKHGVTDSTERIEKSSAEGQSQKSAPTPAVLRDKTWTMIGDLARLLIENDQTVEGPQNVDMSVMGLEPQAIDSGIRDGFLTKSKNLLSEIKSDFGERGMLNELMYSGPFSHGTLRKVLDTEVRDASDIRIIIAGLKRAARILEERHGLSDRQQTPTSRKATGEKTATAKTTLTRDWPGDWRLMEDGFRRQSQSSVRADWQHCSFDGTESWRVTGDHEHIVGEVKAFGIQAGRLLIASPLSSQPSAEIRSQLDDLNRWLYFLKEKYGLSDSQSGVETARDGRTHAVTTGSINKLAMVSARACVECAAMAFTS